MEWTAIQVNLDSEGEVVAMSLGRRLAVLALLLSTVIALTLPAAAALGFRPLAVALPAAGGLLAAAAVGVKSAALVWGLASKGSDPELRAPALGVE